MPEGLDAMGAEALRDILTFIAPPATISGSASSTCARPTPPTAAAASGATTSTTETVPLHRFGDVTVNGVPFFVMDPADRSNGTNLIALKGGPGTGIIADEFPQRVEIPTAVTAASLHFLGGVGVWAWPTGGDAARGTPVMKVRSSSPTARRRNTCSKNGEHFADTLVRADVPLSAMPATSPAAASCATSRSILGKKARAVEDRPRELRQRRRAGDRRDHRRAGTGGRSTRLRAGGASAGASAGSAQAPAAGRSAGPKEGGRVTRRCPETKPIAWAPGKTKVLVIGGGSSHNFGQFFGGTDGATLTAAGFSVNYTEDRDQAAAEIGNADVAVISVNRQFFDTPEYRKALFDFAAAGKGLVMLHPGTWYGYANWPELNATIVGGGARGHDRIAKFSVNAVKPDHPDHEGRAGVVRRSRTSSTT